MAADCRQWEPDADACMNNRSEQLFRLRTCLCSVLCTKQELYLLACFARTSVVVA